jgi:hypothetical protein
MNRKSIIAAAFVLIIAGIAAVTLINSKPGPAQADSPASGKAVSSNTRPQGNGSSERSSPRNRSRDSVKNPELAAKYGESRTNLSKRVSTNVIGLLEDAVEIGELAGSGQANGLFGSRVGMRMALGRLGNDLKLTEEQQVKAAASYAEFQKRERTRTKESIERLKKDPTSLMHLMLASDALARGESTEEEYKQVQSASGEDLKGVLNPLDQKNFRGGKPLQDPAFLNELKTVLDPTQSATLQSAIDEQAATATPAQADEGSIAKLPSMELEKLDQGVESVKKLTTGFKSVMEGMGGLQNLGPMLENPRQPEGGQTDPEAPK